MKCALLALVLSLLGGGLCPALPVNWNIYRGDGILFQYPPITDRNHQTATIIEPGANYYLAIDPETNLRGKYFSVILFDEPDRMIYYLDRKSWGGYTDYIQLTEEWGYTPGQRSFDESVVTITLADFEVFRQQSSENDIGGKHMEYTDYIIKVENYWFCLAFTLYWVNYTGFVDNADLPRNFDYDRETEIFSRMVATISRASQ